MFTKSFAVCSGFALTLALAGCSASDADKDNVGAGGDGATDEVQIELFSWWTAPGEAEALQALVDLHRDRYPNERIYNAATDPKVISGGAEAKEILRMRLAAGDPPDAFQTNAFELANFEPGLLEPLDDLFEAQGLTSDVAPEVLRDVTVDGKILGVPVNVHRANGLFYNKTIFAANDLEPPRTMTEFVDVCEKLKTAGVVPLAISTSQAWIMQKVFQAFALGTLGTEDYIKYFVDKTPVDAEVFAPVADVMDLVLTEYIDVDAAGVEGYGWTQAADALHDGSAAMFIHGDWAKGYLTQVGATPDVDFGVVSSPGSGGAFIYGMDVFSIPSGAKHLEQASDFVSTIASPDGQVAFNAYKGSSPVRLDVPTKGLDSMAVQIYTDFQNSDNRIPEVSLPATWDDAMLKLSQDHDKAAWLQAMIDNPL